MCAQSRCQLNSVSHRHLKAIIFPGKWLLLPLVTSPVSFLPLPCPCHQTKLCFQLLQCTMNKPLSTLLYPDSNQFLFSDLSRKLSKSLWIVPTLALESSSELEWWPLSEHLANTALQSRTELNRKLIWVGRGLCLVYLCIPRTYDKFWNLLNKQSKRMNGGHSGDAPLSLTTYRLYRSTQCTAQTTNILKVLISYFCNPSITLVPGARQKITKQLLNKKGYQKNSRRLYIPTVLSVATSGGRNKTNQGNNKKRKGELRLFSPCTTSDIKLISQYALLLYVLLVYKIPIS